MSTDTAAKGQRPYSIRTRIKTRNEVVSRATAAFVRDHIPLEQGLRHQILKDAGSEVSQRPYSIRTRIKTFNTVIDQIVARIRQRPYSIRTRIKTVQK